MLLKYFYKVIKVITFELNAIKTKEIASVISYVLTVSAMSSFFRLQEY